MALSRFRLRRNMIEEWRIKAKSDQLKFAKSLGDRIWDKFSLPSEEEDLWRKIAYAVAGPPTSDKFEYPAEQSDQISDLKSKCNKYCRQQGWDDVFIAFLFVCAYKDDKNQTVVPLIRVRKSDGTNLKSSYFIDHSGRVYKNWENFLDQNIFSGWWICVPEDAEYSVTDDENVKVTFLDQTERGKVLAATDTVSTATSIGASAMTIVGAILTIFPPTALFGGELLIAGAIAGVPGAVYSAGRSIETLVDRDQHDQTINPFASGEARGCWLMTAATVFSIASMGSGAILSQTAKAGLLADSGLRAFCTGLGITSLSVNGLGVVNSIYEVAKKKEVTPLDVLNLTTSILFFAHSAVTFKTASSIIKDAQHEVITAQREQVAPRNRPAFDQMHRAHQEMKPGRVRVMHGNKEFIRELKRIDNVKDFFEAFQVVNSNELSVNQELVIDPKAFLQMTEKQRMDLLKHSNDLHNGKITEQQFHENVSSISGEYGIAFERQRPEAVANIEASAAASMEAMEVGGELEPRDDGRLNRVFTETGENNRANQGPVNVARKVTSFFESKPVDTFVKVAEPTVSIINNVVSLIQQNPNPVVPNEMKAEDFLKKNI